MKENKENKYTTFEDLWNESNLTEEEKKKIKEQVKNQGLNIKEKEIKYYIEMCKRTSNKTQMSCLLSGMFVALDAHGIKYEWLDKELDYYYDDYNLTFSKLDGNVFGEYVRRGLSGEMPLIATTATHNVRCEDCEKLITKNTTFYVIEDGFVCCEQCKESIKELIDKN